MFQLKIFRTRTLGAYKICSRTLAIGENASGDGSEGGKPKDKTSESSASNELTDKINQLLKDMASKSAQPKAVTETAKFQEVGTHRKISKRPTPKKTPLEDLKDAASAAAKSIGGDASSIEKEILAKALGEGPTPDPVDLNWSQLISGMAVDNTQSPESQLRTRSQQVKEAFSRVSREYTDFKESDLHLRAPKVAGSRVQKVNLFNGKPLGIFKKQTPNYGTEMKLWNDFEEYNLRLATTHPPNNYFEKMILWTKQGKIWKFPINNEQGMDEEQKVSFEDHIFLEKHLEGWCPNKGPIRHFMELVCVGLSKNPYYKVQDKIDHIMWFKEYFESKKELLMEVGAYGNNPTPKISA